MNFVTKMASNVKRYESAMWRRRSNNSRKSAVAALDLLLALNVAKSLGDLSPLKSVGLHKLKGERKNQWATSVNARWRICFTFSDGDAYDVEIVDYRRG